MLLLFLASVAHADAVKPADIYVVDGDTIEGSASGSASWDSTRRSSAATPAAALSERSRRAPRLGCGR
jgi:hypothetical protein